MKTIPIQVADEYEARTRHLAYVLILERRDGMKFGITSASDTVTIQGLQCRPEGGLAVSSTIIRSGVAVDNLELSTLNDGEVFDESDIMSKRWNNTLWMLARYDYRVTKDPDLDVIIAGIIGSVRIEGQQVIIDMRGLQQYLQQPTVSRVLTSMCTARLGDERCRVDMTGRVWNGTVTTPGQQVFASTDLVGRPDDYFGNGELIWNSGINQGLEVSVKTNTSGGQVTLQLPMFQQVSPGDEFTIRQGCRKRLEEDCVGIFNNAVNHQGHPHVPGLDQITKTS